MKILALTGVILLLILCAVLLIRDRRLHRALDTLSDDIEEYLSCGKRIRFDTADNAFSRLHNDVSDLCDALERQKQNNRRDSLKNAQFVSDVSHQLKTPLAGIRLYCEMQQSLCPSDNGEKQLKLLDKTERLIRSLLRLQKLKADAYELHFDHHRLGQLLRETAEPFQALYPEKKLLFTGDADLRCDGEWLSQAFGNVLKNACEHTLNDGTVCVRVEKAETSVTVSFEDDGGGVSEEELPLLFDRFYRSKRSKPDSTGLGLAFTKEIVEKHHGIVSAENTASGLRVLMCFPLIDAAEKITE